MMYNFIFWFFYRFWEKRGNDGRIIGAAHVLFSLLVHIGLIMEVVHWVWHYKVMNFPDQGTYGRNKSVLFFLMVPIWIILWFYFNRARTNRLLTLYDTKYKEKSLQISLYIILFFILPLAALLILVVVRQRGLI